LQARLQRDDLRYSYETRSHAKASCRSSQPRWICLRAWHRPRPHRTRRWQRITRRCQSRFACCLGGVKTLRERVGDATALTGLSRL
jgi:hypothetical protein